MGSEFKKISELKESSIEIIFSEAPRENEWKEEICMYGKQIYILSSNKDK